MEKTIKVIDLLNMMSNGNIPRKVKYNGKVYEYENSEEDYATFIIDHYEYLLDDINIISQLNNEIEIIEDEKPKEIGLLKYEYKNMYGNISQHKHSEIDIIDKINELTMSLNYLLKKEGKENETMDNK